MSWIWISPDKVVLVCMKFLFIERKYKPRLIKNAFILANVARILVTIFRIEPINYFNPPKNTNLYLALALTQEKLLTD